jgi:two-component system, OmpR family, response regulator CpxR
MTILIVDDDAGIRQLLLLFLEHKGYTATTVANGREALNQLQSNQPLPMLILLDLMMPVMDGAAFRQAQQADPRIAAIPVVVLSAAESVESQVPLLTADAYIPKPIEFDNLLQVVEQYYQRSRAHGMQAPM